MTSVLSRPVVPPLTGPFDRGLAWEPSVRPEARPSIDYTQSLAGRAMEGARDEAVGTGSRRGVTMARFRVETNATRLRVEADITDDLLGLECSRIAIESGAAYAATPVPATTGVSIVDISIPGSGLRELRVTAGGWRGGTGGFIRRLTALDGGVLRVGSLPSPTGKRALLIAHDSLPQNIAAGIHVEHNTIGKLRLAYPNTFVVCEGTGGNTYPGTPGNISAATYAALMAADAAATGVDAANVIIAVMLGTNNWAQDTTLADVQSRVAAFATALASALPSATITFWKIPPRTAADGGGVNGDGKTLQQHNDAIEAGLVTAGVGTFVNRLLIPDSSYTFDQTHWANSGHDNAVSEVATQYSLT